MFDFGALPPEINSARIYFGPGSAPLMAAASAWDALAAQLELYAAGYSSVLAELVGQSWSGSSSITMVNAVTPYLAWATAMAARAEQAANQARAAAAGFEMAFSATVPPPVVADNRIQLAVLVATNVFGQNAAAIAACEIAYAEMWAQDAAAMYGYAASSLAATALPPFTQPPQTTTVEGPSAQAAAAVQAASLEAGQTQVTVSQLISALSQPLHTLTSGLGLNAAAADASATTPTSLLLTAVSDFNTLVTSPAQPFWSTTYAVFQWVNYGYAAKADLESHNTPTQPKPVPERLVNTGPKPLQSGSPGTCGPVLVSMGRAAPVGGLSVPHGWALPTIPASADALRLSSAATGFRALPAWAANPTTNPAGWLPTTAAGPLTSGGEHQTSSTVFRMRDRRFRMPRPSLGG